MLINRKKLDEVIGTTLEVMEEKQLNSLEDLEKWVGHRFIPDSERKEEYLQVSENLETPSLIISYIIEGAGIPLEININRQQEHSKVFVKCDELLSGGYLPFKVDEYGNTVQSLDLLTQDIQRVKGHLRSLL